MAFIETSVDVKGGELLLERSFVPSSFAPSRFVTALSHMVSMGMRMKGEPKIEGNNLVAKMEAGKEVVNVTVKL